MFTDRKASPKELSDEMLIARVSRGDTSALETLYDRHAALLLGVCLKLTQDRTTAEQVLQEIFWQVWQRASTYQIQQGSFMGWLFRIARELAGPVRKKTG